MRKLSTVQTDSATWAADSTIGTNVERIGLITRIDFTVEITPSATLSGANQPDGLNRLIQNFRLLGGSHTYINLPGDDACLGGTMLHWMNRIDGLGLGHPGGAITAPQQTFTPMKFTFHMGARPRRNGRDNKFDLSSFIPAGGESSLRAEWVTSGNDVADDTVTISSAVGRFGLHRIEGNVSEVRAEAAAQGVQWPHEAPNGVVPAWNGNTVAITATATDFNTVTDELPTGGWLKRTIIGVQDATATRSVRASDEITRIQLLNVKGSQVLFEQTVGMLTGYLDNADQAIADDAGAIFQGSAPTGIYVVDYRDIVATGGPKSDYGFYMGPPLNRGDLRFGYLVGTNASGDDRLLLHERYIATPIGLQAAQA